MLKERPRCGGLIRASERARAGFLPRRATRSSPREWELRPKVKVLCEEGSVSWVSRGPSALTHCGYVWCRHSLCRLGLWLKSVWNLVVLFLESYTVTDTGHDGWSYFSIVYEQKDPKGTRCYLPKDPLLVWLCSGVAQEDYWGCWAACQSLREELSGSTNPRWASPLLTEMLGHVFWWCEWLLCVSPKRATGFVLPTEDTAFAWDCTCSPRTHCCLKVTLGIRFTTFHSAWTSQPSHFHGLELR